MSILIFRVSNAVIGLYGAIKQKISLDAVCWKKMKN